MASTLNGTSADEQCAHALCKCLPRRAQVMGGSKAACTKARANEVPKPAANGFNCRQQRVTVCQCHSSSHRLWDLVNKFPKWLVPDQKVLLSRALKGPVRYLYS